MFVTAMLLFDCPTGAFDETLPDSDWAMTQVGKAPPEVGQAAGAFDCPMGTYERATALVVSTPLAVERLAGDFDSAILVIELPTGTSKRAIPLVKRAAGEVWGEFLAPA